MIMKNLPLLFLLLFFACYNESNNKDISAQKTLPAENITIETVDNPELDYEKLRFYPIIADKDFIAKNNISANFKNLKEAMNIKGFRITEKKPFGRFEDSGAVNNLTVQNKSQDTIYLMAGDVIQGGKQDRVLAVDMVVPPRTISDIPVFCVEPKRWEYKESNSSSDDPDLALRNNHIDEQNKKIFAFTGYYNVASNDLRKTMKKTNDQGKVWEKVGDLTALNNAESTTGAYANLENSKLFTDERNDYVHFFTGKFDHRNDIIGMLAVSGTKILGTDIFNHPSLFKKQYEVLMHSYITEAISSGDKVIMSEASIKRQSKALLKKFDAATQSNHNDQSTYSYKGRLIHFTDL